MEASLENTSPWLLGDTFSAADVSVAYALMLAENLEMASGFGPGTRAYWERARQRDAFKRALKRQAEAATTLGVS